jgi:hypothetical protein
MRKLTADRGINQRAARALDALNFCLADVRAGLGPYLVVYLLTVRQWNEAEIEVASHRGPRFAKPPPRGACPCRGVGHPRVTEQTQ